MADPQPPEQPPSFPLVDAALTGQFAPQPDQTFADIAIEGSRPAPAPVPVPQQPATVPAGLPGEQPAPPYTGRAAELLSLLSPEAQEATLAARQAQLNQQAHAARLQAEEEEQAGLGGALESVGKSFAEGLYGGVFAIPRGVAALGYAATGSELLGDFARDTAPKNLFPAFASAYADDSIEPEGPLDSSSQAWLDSERERAAQQREWPTLSTVAEGAGLIASSLGVAYAGAAGVGGLARATGLGSQALRGATAGELAFGGSAVRQAAIAGAEGVLQGAASPFDDAGTPTSRDILQSALLGGLLSAGIAGVATGIGNKLSKLGKGGRVADDVADAIPPPPPGGKPAAVADEVVTEPLEELQAKVFSNQSSAERAVDDIMRREAPDMPPSAGREALEIKQVYDELDAARRAKIAAAGDNPIAIQKAADEATAEMGQKLDNMKASVGTITEDNYRGIKSTLRPLLRNEILEAGSRDLERTNNALMKATDTIEAFLDEAPQKAAKVRANFLADNLDNKRAMGEAYGTLQEIKRSFGDTLLQQSREVKLKKGAGAAAREVRPLEPDPEFWASHGGKIKSVERTLKKADEAFANAKDAADVYIAMDQARREIAAQVSGLARAAGSSDPRVADPARLLRKWSQEEYLGRLVPHLGDTALYGKQGAAQSAVNIARRDVIASGYLGDLTTVLQRDFGEAVRITDPKQTRALLDEIDNGQRSLKHQQLLKNYSALEDMASAVKNGYELTPKQAEAVESMFKQARGGREIMQHFEQTGSALREKIIKSLMGKGAAAATGILAGGLAGGPLGSVIGAAVLPAVQEAMTNVVRRFALSTTAKAAAKETAEAGAKEAGVATGKQAGGKIIPIMSKGGSRKLSAAALGLGVPASGALFEPTQGKSREERVKIYEARRKALNEITSNPARMQEAFERTTGDLGSKRPVMTGVMNIELGRKLKTLRDDFPGKTELSLAGKRKKSPPSHQELAKSEALWEAATDPTSVFDDWENGAVNYDKARYSQKIYPGVWDLYRAALVDSIAQLPEDQALSDNRLTQLDYLFGFGGKLSPTAAPDFSKRFDAYNAELAQQSQPSGGAGSLNLPSTQPTFTQKVASGGRSA